MKHIEAVRAWLVDVDGTLAIRSSRAPFDWSEAGSDLPNHPVVTVVRALSASSSKTAIILVTGREEKIRGLTEEWLERHSIPYHLLLMRKNGDYRRDEIVKSEIYRQEIAPRFSVEGVIDDRNRVVSMWRSLGLVCFQVADADY